MATYVGLIQFADQGIRNIKDTVKRGDAAMAAGRENGDEGGRGILDNGCIRRGRGLRCTR